MDPLETFVTDVRGIFGTRLDAIVVYEAVAPAIPEKANNHIQTLTLADTVRFEDIARCAARNAAWARIGLATPLVMGNDEFRRSLDTFALEYGNIITTHRVLVGSDPFKDLTVKTEDLRHAAEVLAKSHLVHLREAYIEAHGQPAVVARMMVASVAPFKALLMAMAHLRGRPTRDEAQLVREAAAIGLDESTVRRIVDLRHTSQIPGGETASLYARYLSVVEQLTHRADRWDRESEK
ncbi:MAG: hypothetical protein ACRD1Q_15010 [Vicinamibacterales bacterium]